MPEEKVDHSIITRVFTFIAMLGALIAFAANSVLCRWALGDDAIDANSFTIVRLTAGAAMLFILVQFLNKPQKSNRVGLRPLKNKRLWIAPLMLFSYAIFFSYAYIELNAATGALILFVTVQLTMVGHQIYRGNKLKLSEWTGLVMALMGLFILLGPQAGRPSVEGTLLMMIAGVSWGFYTLEGSHSKSPLRDTAANFIGTLPPVIMLSVVSIWFIELSWKGIGLAVLSGAFASGLGYAIWYLVLPKISIVTAAVGQLSVPLITAAGGVLLIGEEYTMNLAIAGALILGGCLLVSLAKPKGNKALKK